MATADCWTDVASFRGTDLLIDTRRPSASAWSRHLQERGVKPEWEVMSPAHMVKDMIPLCDAGYDKPPYFVNIVLGIAAFQGALPYTPRLLQMMVDLLPPESIFCVSAIGPAQLPATTVGILLGGHVRVGLEDNLYLLGGAAGDQRGARRAHRADHPRARSRAGDARRGPRDDRPSGAGRCVAGPGEDAAEPATRRGAPVRSANQASRERERER